jgi:hypothetical protein
MGKVTGNQRKVDIPIPAELSLNLIQICPMVKYHLKPSFINFISYPKETQECFGLEFLSKRQLDVVDRILQPGCFAIPLGKNTPRDCRP